MRKSLKTIAAASALIAGLTSASVLFAHEGSNGTMGGNPGSMMGGGPGGMMGMMGQMGRMAQNCNTMSTSMMTNDGPAPGNQGKAEAQPVPPQGNDQGQ